MGKDIHISLAAEPLIHLGPFTITNSLLVTWLVMALVLVLAAVATRRVKIIPGAVQNIFEYLFEFLLSLIESVTGSRKKAEKFFPLLATFFIFILFANLSDIIPGIGSIGAKEVIDGASGILPFFRPPSSDLNFTLALAIISVAATQFFGIAALGFFKHLGKFFTIKGGPIKTFVGLLELVSEVAKMVSFSFRLFGNIFAGEVLLTVIAVIVPFVVPLPFYLLEAFVALIQALVFTMLSLVFFTVATSSHDEEHEEEPKSNDAAGKRGAPLADQTKQSNQLIN